MDQIEEVDEESYYSVVSSNREKLGEKTAGKSGVTGAHDFSASIVPLNQTTNERQIQPTKLDTEVKA